MNLYRYLQFAMYSAYSYGPIFGAGHDLHIGDHCHRNTTSFSHLGYTYKLPAGYTFGTTEPRSLLAGSYWFKVDEYEVFFQPGKFESNNRKT